MTAVTFPNGNSYSDDGTTANDMRNGGFRTNLLPMIGDTITVANSAVTAAAAAVPAAAAATTGATTATNQAAIATAAANTAASLVLVKQPNETAGIDPALDFVFSSSLALPAGVVTSSSAKYVFDRAGLLTSVASLTPPIDFDPVTSVTRGLLVEESRTNLLLYSNQFDNAAWTKTGASVSANAATAPDGTATADKLVEDTSNGNHNFRQAASATSGIAYTGSVYVKAAGRTQARLVLESAGLIAVADYDLTAVTATVALGTSASISPEGNGWYRLSITATTNSAGVALNVRSGSGGTTSYTGDGSSGLYLWQAQAEAGTFATSPIPTTSATVTRAADVNTLLLSSVPGWNASEGTIYVEARTALGSGGQVLAQIDDGTGNNRIVVFRSSGNAMQCTVTSGGTLVANLSLGSVANDTSFKLALSWKSSSFAASLNGGSAVTSSSGATPSGLTTLRIGSDGGSFWNSSIKRLTAFPRALPSTVQLLTA